jgi:hypothetical protein
MKSENGLNATTSESLRLYQEGNSITAIAALRNITEGTVCGHLAQAVTMGLLDLSPRDFYSEAEEAQIAAAVAEHGLETLGALHQALNGEITYAKLHFFRAFAKRAAGGD